MKYSQLDQGNQEEVPNNQSNKLGWHCALLIGMILGLIALISNEDAKDEHPFPFIFTLIYILADVGSAFIALCTIAIARLCQHCSSNYIGMFVICTSSLSNLIHVTAIISGPIIFYNDVFMPLSFLIFVGYSIILASRQTAVYVGSCCREGFQRPQLIGVSEQQFQDAEKLIQEARQMKGTKAKNKLIEDQDNFQQLQIELNKSAKYPKLRLPKISNNVKT